jgi:hypothetical protein
MWSSSEFFYMPLKHKDRPNAGFLAEESTAKEMEALGHKVERLAKNNRGADMKINGKPVEVKAAIETSYKGSDGYPITGHVFSNMKTDPNSKLHILKCMSKDRKRVLKEYHIPSKEIMQKTLTITGNGKYERFRKQAADQASPYRMYDKRPLNSLKTYYPDDSVEREMIEVPKPKPKLGSVKGVLMGVGAATLASLYDQRKQQTYNKTVSVEFDKILIGAAVGAVIGRKI